MKTILIVCGAGASSTFLASRIRAIAKSRGLDLLALAGSQDDLAHLLPTVDVVLVGPHLADAFPAIARSAASSSLPAGLLPSDAFSASGAERALDLAGALLVASLTSSNTEGTSNA